MAPKRKVAATAAASSDSPQDVAAVASSAAADASSKKSKKTTSKAAAAAASLPVYKCANPSAFSISIERCTSWGTYRSKGNALLAALSSSFPDNSVTIASGTPKRGSFDIKVTVGDKVTNVWNGLSMGPPRALKFVDHAEAVRLVHELVKDLVTE